MMTTFHVANMRLFKRRFGTTVYLSNELEAKLITYIFADRHEIKIDVWKGDGFSPFVAKFHEFYTKHIHFLPGIRTMDHYNVHYGLMSENGPTKLHEKHIVHAILEQAIRDIFAGIEKIHTIYRQGTRAYATWHCEHVRSTNSPLSYEDQIIFLSCQMIVNYELVPREIVWEQVTSFRS